MKNYEIEIQNYFTKLKDTISKIDIKNVSLSMDAITECYKSGGTIYTFGNGGSASTASHIVCDFCKGISENKQTKFNIFCLSDNIATLTAIANDLGYEEIFEFQLKNKLKPNDLIIAISGSGNSKNIIRAVNYAKSQQVKVIGFSGYDGGKLKQLANCHMHVPIDDMQIVEDIHLIFDHMMMRIFSERL